MTWSNTESEELEGVEDVCKIGDLVATGRRGAGDIVENLAILHAVIGQPIDPAAAVKVDGDNPLIDHLLRHESHRTLRALRDVVKHLAAYGRDRRRRTEDDQHLLLARSNRNLLERAFRDQVTLLVDLG